MDHRIEKILISSRQINRGVKKAANWINKTFSYENCNLIMIGLLKGCVPFYGQLISKIKVDVETDFMFVSSFKGETKRVTKPEIIIDIQTNIEGKDVLLVEDIVDSAFTINYVKEYLKSKNPKTIRTISFLDKKAGRKCDFELDYYCYDIEDKFLVGYGLDYKEKLRNLPYIGVFKKQ